jgi:hypothetical protein
VSNDLIERLLRSPLGQELQRSAREEARHGERLAQARKAVAAARAEAAVLAEAAQEAQRAFDYAVCGDSRSELAAARGRLASLRPRADQALINAENASGRLVALLRRDPDQKVKAAVWFSQDLAEAYPQGGHQRGWLIETSPGSGVRRFVSSGQTNATPDGYRAHLLAREAQAELDNLLLEDADGQRLADWKQSVLDRIRAINPALLSHFADKPQDAPGTGLTAASIGQQAGDGGVSEAFGIKDNVGAL